MGKLDDGFPRLPCLRGKPTIHSHNLTIQKPLRHQFRHAGTITGLQQQVCIQRRQPGLETADVRCQRGAVFGERVGARHADLCNGGAQAGSFDESVVQEVMYAHQEDMIGCYAEGLEQDETLAGEVKFHFRVAKDGHVALVKITSSGLRHKDTEDCLVDAARRWSFPATGQAGLAKFDTSFEFAAQ